MGLFWSSWSHLFQGVWPKIRSFQFHGLILVQTLGILRFSNFQKNRKIPNVWTKIRPWNLKLRIIDHTPWKRGDQELQKGPLIIFKKIWYPLKKGIESVHFPNFSVNYKNRKYLMFGPKLDNEIQSCEFLVIHPEKEETKSFKKDPLIIFTKTLIPS